MNSASSSSFAMVLSTGETTEGQRQTINHNDDRMVQSESPHSLDMIENRFTVSNYRVDEIDCRGSMPSISQRNITTLELQEECDIATYSTRTGNSCGHTDEEEEDDDDTNSSEDHRERNGNCGDVEEAIEFSIEKAFHGSECYIIPVVSATEFNDVDFWSIDGNVEPPPRFWKRCSKMMLIVAGIVLCGVGVWLGVDHLMSKTDPVSTKSDEAFESQPDRDMKTFFPSISPIPFQSPEPAFYTTQTVDPTINDNIKSDLPSESPTQADETFPTIFPMGNTEVPTLRVGTTLPSAVDMPLSLPTGFPLSTPQTNNPTTKPTFEPSESTTYLPTDNTDNLTFDPTDTFLVESSESPSSSPTTDSGLSILSYSETLSNSTSIVSSNNTEISNVTVFVDEWNTTTTLNSTGDGS
jgi:hypothetical protein